MAKKAPVKKSAKSFEESLWDTATKLRGRVEPSEYKIQINSERVFHYFALRGGKAAISGIIQKDVKSVNFPFPSEEAKEKSSAFTRRILERILMFGNQSRVLERLRGRFLPHLIFGEIRPECATQIAKETRR